jgi:hypothetical protein
MGRLDRAIDRSESQAIRDHAIASFFAAFSLSNCSFPSRARLACNRNQWSVCASAFQSPPGISLRDLVLFAAIDPPSPPAAYRCAITAAKETLFPE